MDADELRAEIERLEPWLQAIELAPGISTATPGHPRAAGEAAFLEPSSPVKMGNGRTRRLFPDGMAGRSMLECGCIAGGHISAAVARGAGRCFGFDARRHWIDQAH